jgi:DNA polymerase-3 subunit delta'
MTAAPAAEPDRIAGVPHPRETSRLFGHAAAEAAVLAAEAGGRMHHGWLIGGPRGVGKATLAWRIARFLLATPAADGGLFAPPPPASLDIPPDHPVARRLAALSEPRLVLVRRPWDDKAGRLRAEITVDEVRRAKAFFALSAADGGRRVAIVDAADELNANAANALLKLLEEPPAGAVLLLVAHQPARLLPTIRSRCRMLRLDPLGPADLAAALAGAGVPAEQPERLAELADGSAGEAVRLVREDGLALYARLVALFATLPGLDRMAALAVAEAAAGRGAEGRFDMTLSLLDRLMARLARAGVTGRLPGEAAPGEAALLARLAPGAAAGRGWAELAQTLSLRARRGRAVNLDPAALLMDMLLRIDAAAGTLART